MYRTLGIHTFIDRFVELTNLVNKVGWETELITFHSFY